MKAYWVIAISGILVFVGGFYYLYYSFNKQTAATTNSQSETALLEQLDEEGKAEYQMLNNAEFENEAIPLNEEAMGKI